MKMIRSVSLLFYITFCAQAVERDSAFCRDPGVIQNGWQNVTGVTKPYRVGTVIKFHCKENYKLAKKGHPKIQCMENGKWSGKVPKCVAQSCLSEVPEVPFATWTSRCNKPYSIGCTVTYSCVVGYTHVNDPVKTCDKSGKWTGDFFCKSIQCPKLQKPQNGNLFYKSRNFSSVASYTCNEGYFLKGQERRICLGTWTGTNPVCVILCQKPRLPQHGNWTAQYQRNFNQFTPGTFLTYKCDQRYRINGLFETMKRFCHSDGHWSSSEPTCELYSCADIDNYQNQPEITYSRPDKRIGTVATFRCLKDGYKLIGPHESTCLPSGSWSKEKPECSPIECDPPSNPHLGNVEPNNPDKFRYRSFVKYTCKANFYLWGNSTRQCLANKGNPYWTGDDPECLSLMDWVDKCKQLPGHHMSRKTSKLQCVLEGTVLPPTGNVRLLHTRELDSVVPPLEKIDRTPRSRELDTLTIVTACAGSTLGALVILLIVLVCVRKLHRTRRFRHAAFRSRRYSYDDDRVALIAAYASDVHFILPSYDEAMSQVDRSPPPFDSVVNTNSDTRNNNDNSSEDPNGSATGEGQNCATTPTGNEGRIHIVFNPMAERRNINRNIELASITEIPEESHENSQNSPVQGPSEGVSHGSSATVVDSRNT